MKNEEHYLQVACVQWFRLQYPQYARLLFAVPNGGHRSITTARRLKSEGVTAGVSDLIFLKSCKGYKFFCIEMKTKIGKQTATQVEFQLSVELEGGKYLVCRSLDEFMHEINNYLKKN